VQTERRVASVLHMPATRRVSWAELIAAPNRLGRVLIRTHHQGLADVRFWMRFGSQLRLRIKTEGHPNRTWTMNRG
jgi:hypothetical protein